MYHYMCICSCIVTFSDDEMVLPCSCGSHGYEAVIYEIEYEDEV